MNKKEIMTCALAAIIIPLSSPLAFGDDAPEEISPTPIITFEPAPELLPELLPCEHEDSTNCYWDATTRGNGEGDSFTVTADGQYTYDAPARTFTPALPHAGN